MKTFIIIFLTIVGGFAAIVTLFALGIMAVAAYKWWVENPPKEPVYDSSVRLKEDKSPAIIVGLLAAAWIVAQLFVVFA